MLPVALCCAVATVSLRLTLVQAKFLVEKTSRQEKELHIQREALEYEYAVRRSPLVLLKEAERLDFALPVMHQHVYLDASWE